MDSENKAMSMGSPSDELWDLFVEIISKYEELSGMLDISDVFNSEGLDVDLLNKKISQYRSAAEEISNISTTNDVDQQYAKYYAYTLSTIAEIFELLIENEDIASVFNTEDDKGFFENIAKEAEKNFESWEEAIDN